MLVALLLTLLVALAGGCSTSRGTAPAAPVQSGPGLDATPDGRSDKPARGADASAKAAVGERIQRPAAQWVRGRWEDLPGWSQDPVGQVLGALRAGCGRATAAWRSVCEGAQGLDPRDHAAVRVWMMSRLQPWQVQDSSGGVQGLLTGYHEPQFEARRRPNAEFAYPVHAPPADLTQRRPYWSREQLETRREARAALRGRELAWLRSPIDVLVLQIQGSGRLTITEPDGQRRTVRMAFAAHNDHPYVSVGRWLIDQGEITVGQASWPGIRDWMQRHPDRVQRALWANPRVVFFREEPLPDPEIGPRGAQGVPLTPGRSIAVDPRSVPYGSLVWLDTLEPLRGLPLQRAVMAQDTGSAITGAVRADFFWGWDERAEQQAGRTRQRLRMWVLWPAGSAPP